ncbi:MAG: hypothetical protein NZ889_03030 [Candidatus Pacearchaeota archaeon]|nr:hypothetical protein [Candidatus Pacearchaeota archaeon]
MEESKPAFILNLIGSILVFIFATISFIGLIKAKTLFEKQIPKEVPIEGVGLFMGKEIITLMWGLTIIWIIIGILMLISALMIKEKKKVVTGSVLGLVSSIVGIVIGAGLFIGPVLGIVGSILGLISANK